MKKGFYNRIKPKIVVLLVVIALLGITLPALAQTGTVNAILFYSTSCPHCHKVIDEDLPPLLEKYGERLKILGINVSALEGQQLYQAAVQRFNIPQERLGVPALIVGDTVLVGSYEIPTLFPDIIEEGLAAGGIGWPDIPGLLEIIPEEEATNTDEQPASESASSEPASSNPQSPIEAGIQELTVAQRFALDPAGNTLAVIVLIGMLCSLVGVGYNFTKTQNPEGSNWPTWFIPTLCLIGLGVAGYLSYVEVTQSEAVCGPVGDCNTVQQSAYAVLFGILPIGVLGVVGYILILIAWLVQYYGPSSLRKAAAIALWLMAILGVLFSIYLTFLEPFVIGATCAWCIVSAIMMTLVLWASTKPAKFAWAY